MDFLKEMLVLRGPIPKKRVVTKIVTKVKFEKEICNTYAYVKIILLYMYVKKSKDRLHDPAL